MNEEPDPQHDSLRALLREARPGPPLPPRFQESVWRRIENTGTPVTPRPSPGGWLEGWVERLLLPRFAMATLGLLLITGGLTGVITSADATRQRAQERYLSTVAPPPLR